MGDDWRRTSGAVGCARTVPVLLLFPEHEFVHDPHGLGPLPARAPAALEPSAEPKPAAGAPVSSVAEVEGLCAPPRPVYHDSESSARAQAWHRLRFSMGGALRFALLLALITVSDSYVLRPPPCRAARRACAIRAQLVPVEKPDDDDDDGLSLIHI